MIDEEKKTFEPQIFVGLLITFSVCGLFYEFGKARGILEADQICIDTLGEAIEKIEEIEMQMRPKYNAPPCDDCPKIKMEAWDSHTESIGDLNIRDNRYTFFFDFMCDDNKTAQEVVCECAKNTDEPCMAYCYTCI